MGSILIRNIKLLAGIRRHDERKVQGEAMSTLPSLENVYLLMEGGFIKAFGPNADAPERADEVIDATGKMVLPAWCDSHTHIVYAGPRDAEFVDKINGLTYEEIAQRGGGILNSARLLNETSEEALFDSALARLEEVKNWGTGAVEIKSGYGLTYEGELKMLRVIRRLKQEAGIPVKATAPRRLPPGIGLAPFPRPQAALGWTHQGGRRACRTTQHCPRISPKAASHCG